MSKNRSKSYISIDLKSFYASVECIERGLNPLDTNLVVADNSRTEKTICLAVSPALKSYGVPGRPRLFEVIRDVKSINYKRLKNTPQNKFTGKSFLKSKLDEDTGLKLDYLIAPPRMALYIKYSTEIYNIYLKYIAPEDIHVYSIDEVFINASPYLSSYSMTEHDLAMKMIKDVLDQTGITATAGIGTNLYLSKIAMDILAKHIPADQNGVRIAKLDEMSYRKILWTHRPITDFWRVGKGYAKKLEAKGLYTMGDIAKCSVGKRSDYYNEDLLYKIFGKNAELLIDHSWGYEPCTIKDIKSYKPSRRSLGSGQVLQSPYSFKKAELVTWEMSDLLVLDLVEKHLVTNKIVLTIGYDAKNLTEHIIRNRYKGPVTTDSYGRKIPKHAHGTFSLNEYTSSGVKITAAIKKLYTEIVNPDLLIRRITLSFDNVINEKDILIESKPEQITFFKYCNDKTENKEGKKDCLKKEKQLQNTVLSIKHKFGKNAVLKAGNLKESATAKSRNSQIGGHKA